MKSLIRQPKPLWPVTIILICFCLITGRGFSQDYRDLSTIVPIIKAGDYKKAISFLKKYNDHYPDRVDGIILLGQAYMGIPDYNSQDLAIKTFEEGLRRDPDNTVLLDFLADLNQNRKMSSRAQYYLERSISVDPNNPEALQQLIQEYVAQQNIDGLRNLESSVAAWVNANPDSARGYAGLGDLYLALGQGDKSIETLNKGLEADPGYSPIHRLLADAYLFKGNGALFTEAYYYWLSNVKNSDILAEEYKLFEFAVSEADAVEFNDTPPAKKPEFMVQYWREHDPNPVTLENERLVEHFARLYYVKAHFHSTASPLGFDDRGEVYLKWGPPEERFSDPMPSISQMYDSDLENYNNLANITIDPEMKNVGYGSPQSFAIRGNESWYYPSIDYYLAFDFVNYGGYYRRVMSLDEAIPGMHVGQAITIMQDGSPDERQKINSLKQLYANRSHLGGFYARLGGTSLDNLSSEIISQVVPEKASALAASKPRYELSLEIDPLVFSFRPYQFRGDSGKTRIEFDYGLDMNQLKPIPPAGKADSVISFKFYNDVVFFDSLRHRVMHQQFEQKRAYPAGYDYGRILFMGESVCKLLPGPYELVYQMVELSNRMGKYETRDISVRDYSGKDLILSDLKLSPQVEFLGIDQKTGLDHLKITPYPFDFVNAAHPVFVFFEIYNLGLTPEGNSEYEISIRMERRLEKGEYVLEAMRAVGRIFVGGKAQEIETFHTRKGNNPASKEYIQLDLSGFPRGNSRLTVTIHDLVLDKATENNISFELTE